LDLIDHKWVKLRDHRLFPPPLSFHSMAVDSANVIVFGGFDERQNINPNVWIGTSVFDAVTGEVTDLVWSQANIKSAARPAARIRHTAVGLGGQMFLFGGQDVSKLPLGDFWKYQPDSAFWTQFMPASTMAGSVMPSARYSHTLTVVGDSIYLFGGTTSIGIVDDLWVYTPMRNSITQLLPMYPGLTKSHFSW
jgi:hypothetical protein